MIKRIHYILLLLLLTAGATAHASLTNLEVSTGTTNLITNFSSENLTYEVPQTTTKVNVIAIPATATATVDITVGTAIYQNPSAVDMASVGSISIKVTDGNNSTTYTVKKAEPAFTGKRVHIQPGWNACYAYYYQNEETTGAAWPGKAMPKDANGWYTVDLEDTWVDDNTLIIFTESAGSSNRYPGSDQPGIKVSECAEAWFIWESKSWTCENPDGPKAPTVTISPNGGKVRGESIIKITISGDNISASSIMFGNTVITPSGETTQLAVADYMQDGEMKTLSVSATNDIGTTPVTVSFTRDDSAPVKTDHFTWDNALVYFVLTDRFYNGDPSNDNSYYRQKGLAGDVATFHGGDIAGLTQKLDYLEDLGVNAIWITAPYEQVHGWVSGKGNAFPHYAFHGYYTQDWTFMDKNMGTIEEFRTFVDDAHSRGIRIVMDIVLNHTGYNTIEDMITYNFGSTTVTQHGWAESSGGQWNKNHDVTDYNSPNWGNWWSGWVRAFDGKFGFGTPGGSEETQCLANLPDVMTEKTTSVAIPAFLKTKWNAENESSGFGPWMLPTASNLRGDNMGAPADYIIKWLIAWVREFGIDGFRCDTAKHVEMSRWSQLKQAGVAALNEWRNDTGKSGDSDAKDWTDNFWMTGECFTHYVDLNSTYYSQGGFDSMINFSFNAEQTGSGGRTPTTSDWSSYATTINNNLNGRNVLSYVSSHDTGLHRPGDMKNLGTMLVLLPGGVQIYYGDETARPMAYTGCGDTDMMTRGDMNWDAVDGDVNAHWKKLGKFRKNNPAVGAGKQTDLGSNTYGRKYSDNDGYENAVVIKLNASGTTSVNVNGFFGNGAEVRDAYTGNTATVSNNSVTFTAGSGGVILVEAVK